MQFTKSFEQLTVLDIFPEREIVCVSPNANVDTALKTLQSKRVLSFPVVDFVSRVCVGVLDVLDIAAFVAASVNIPFSASPPELQAFLFNLFSSTSIQQVLEFSIARGPRSLDSSFTEMKPVTIDTSITKLMELFSFGVHRLPIINAEQKIINFISQMDLLRFLAENIFLLGNQDKTTLEELGIGTAEVQYAKSEATVIEALKHMTEKRISALPILTEDNRIVANFSASDLRGIGPNDYLNLFLPLTEFLRLYNPKSISPLTVELSDTLDYCIFKLVATRVHRLWLADELQRVSGVISTTDMVKPFIGIRNMEITHPNLRTAAST